MSVYDIAGNVVATSGGSGGQPIAITQASQMLDTEEIYLYLGNETGYEYGYVYVYLSNTWVKTTLYGKGQDGENGSDGYSPIAAVEQTTTGATITITDEEGTTTATIENGANGTDGSDGFSPVASVVQTANGARISITDQNGTTTADITNGTATDAQIETNVTAWLDNHPEATTTVTDHSITRPQLAEDVTSKIDGIFSDIENAYRHPTYTKATLNNNGTLNTAGNGRVTNLLPVFPGETIVLNSKLTGKVAYFAKDESFIRIVSTTTGLHDYVVPDGAYYAIYQNVYSNGEPRPFSVRRKTQPENKTFFDLIRSPLKQNPKIGFTGDSNTSGYGLPSGSKSWANLFIDGLTDLTTFTYNAWSKWVEAVGVNNTGVETDFMQYAELSIWTDAAEITLIYNNTYSSAWKWIVDGVESGTASTTTLTLDGNLHKVTVRFTGGQLVGAGFKITKSITCTNTAETGMGLQNVPVGSGNDWEFIMIGTNDRNKTIAGINSKYAEYAGKGTYIVPFPNHKTDSTYTNSQMKLYSEIVTAFESMGYQILNLASENAFAFYSSSLYQSDGIHFNTDGHKVIANMISGKMGLPLYLQQA